MDKDIFLEIKESFGALWNCRPRGNSLEIATPVPTSTDKYVTVFLTMRDGKWIVSDGGMTGCGLYDTKLPEDSQTFEKIVNFFKEDFDIKSTCNASGEIFYYKSTRKRELVPNIVFDLSNFIAMVVNDSLIDFHEKKERKLFSTSVRELISGRVGSDRVEFNSQLNDSLVAKFGAVIKNTNGKSSLVNLVTGSTEDYMRKSLGQSNLYYDMLSDSPFSDSVNSRIVLVNDHASGYNAEEMGYYIEICKKKGQIPLSWSHSKKELEDLIA